MNDRGGQSSAQETQKHWYDQNARMRTRGASFGFATNFNQLAIDSAYPIVKQIGEVNYLVNLHNQRKKPKVYHVNMLRKWQAPSTTGYWSEELTNFTKDTGLE